MIDDDNLFLAGNNCEGITQKSMSVLADVAPSTIYRAILDLKIEPLAGGYRKNFRYSVHDTRKILKRYISDKFITKKKMQCFFNFKGGVGKTSICFQVGSHLSLCGYRVLLVDVDAQAHLSTALGISISESYFTFYDACVGNVKIEDTIKTVYEGLDCIPSNFSLSRTDLDVTESSTAAKILNLVFDSIIDKYDFILFDTNATMSYMNVRIISMCDMINIITETQAYGVQSANSVIYNITHSCRDRGLRCPYMTMIPNKYDEKSTVACESMYILREQYSNYLIPDFVIRKSEEFNTANKNSKPLAFFCRSNSIAFEDISKLVKLVIHSSCVKK